MRDGEKTESIWAKFRELVARKNCFSCLCEVVTYNLMLVKEITYGTSVTLQSRPMWQIVKRSSVAHILYRTLKIHQW